MLITDPCRLEEHRCGEAEREGGDDATAAAAGGNATADAPRLEAGVENLQQMCVRLSAKAEFLPIVDLVDRATSKMRSSSKFWSIDFGIAIGWC